jgi:phosphoribosylformylglycinamidine synthase PurS subunit
MNRYQVSVEIRPRAGILDPQGRAVADALRTLGFDQVRDVHIGRYVIVEADAASPSAARDAVTKMCDKLLANPVVEDADITEVKPL